MGKLYKLMEQRDDLYSWIKELESKRIKEDLLNKDKYQDLYDIYYSITNEINKLKGEMEECQSYLKY